MTDPRNMTEPEAAAEVVRLVTTRTAHPAVLLMVPRHRTKAGALSFDVFITAPAGSEYAPLYRLSPLIRDGFPRSIRWDDARECLRHDPDGKGRDSAYTWLAGVLTAAAGRKIDWQEV